MCIDIHTAIASQHKHLEDFYESLLNKKGSRGSSASSPPTSTSRNKRARKTRPARQDGEQVELTAEERYLLNVDYGANDDLEDESWLHGS